MVHTIRSACDVDRADQRHRPPAGQGYGSAGHVQGAETGDLNVSRVVVGSGGVEVERGVVIYNDLPACHIVHRARQGTVAAGGLDDTRRTVVHGASGNGTTAEANDAVANRVRSAGSGDRGAV